MEVKSNQVFEKLEKLEKGGILRDETPNAISLSNLIPCGKSLTKDIFKKKVEVFRKQKETNIKERTVNLKSGKTVILDNKVENNKKGGRPSKKEQEEKQKELDK
jgi:hypothetical protein